MRTSNEVRHVSSSQAGTCTQLASSSHSQAVAASLLSVALVGTVTEGGASVEARSAILRLLDECWAGVMVLVKLRGDTCNVVESAKPLDDVAERASSRDRRRAFIVNMMDDTT